MGAALDRLGGVEKRLCFDCGLRHDERMTEPRQISDFCLIANDESMIGSIAFYTDHLRVIGAADDDDVSIRSGGAGGELLNPGDKGASCVDDLCRFFFEFFLHLRRHAVCSNNSRFAPSYLHRIANRGHAMEPEPLHFLIIMDQWAETSDG